MRVADNGNTIVDADAFYARHAAFTAIRYARYFSTVIIEYDTPRHALTLCYAGAIRYAAASTEYAISMLMFSHSRTHNVFAADAFFAALRLSLPLFSLIFDFLRSPLIDWLRQQAGTEGGGE